MMNDFDITAIEDEVRNILKNIGVSQKIYANRPKATDTANDFVVAMVSGEVQDKQAYGECMFSVYLFAKDIDNAKNSKKLSVMYQKFRRGFPASSGRLLFDVMPTISRDTPDDFGYHRRQIRIHITIKAI
jgi:hypothetical protein